MYTMTFISVKKGKKDNKTKQQLDGIGINLNFCLLSEKKHIKIYDQCRTTTHSEVFSSILFCWFWIVLLWWKMFFYYYFYNYFEIHTSLQWKIFIILFFNFLYITTVFCAYTGQYMINCNSNYISLKLLSFPADLAIAFRILKCNKRSCLISWILNSQKIYFIYWILKKKKAVGTCCHESIINRWFCLQCFWPKKCWQETLTPDWCTRWVYLHHNMLVNFRWSDSQRVFTVLKLSMTVNIYKWLAGCFARYYLYGMTIWQANGQYLKVGVFTFKLKHSRP